MPAVFGSSPINSTVGFNFNFSLYSFNDALGTYTFSSFEQSSKISCPKVGTDGEVKRSVFKSLHSEKALYLMLVREAGNVTSDRF